MKSAPQLYSAATLLALACLSSAIASSHGVSPSPKAKTFVSERRLEDDGFNLGEWAGDIWDSLVGGGDDTDNDTDESGNGGFLGDMDLCSFVEAAIGMGQNFGVEANCSCSGDWNSGLTVACNFDECAPGSEVCGRVDMSIVLGGIDGPVDMTACADFEDGEYKKTCFSYQMELDNGFEQTCQATYGGQPCECSIDNGICLKADCSRFVPGAAIDTCQQLTMSDSEDLQNFFPDFEIFQPDFQLQAENVPWENLDFENVDFANFDVANLEWGDNFFSTNGETWVDLIGTNPTLEDAEGLSQGVCKLLFRAANLSQDLSTESSSCKCGFDETKGALELSCDFEETCTGSDDPLCGSVSLNLTYASLTEIHANVCIQYLEFPETCYSYGVPFAPIEAVGGLTQPSFFQDCTAQYGSQDNNCKCTVDENSCLKVDCTEYEPLAITRNCQAPDLENIAEDPSRVLLDFQTPTAQDVVSDGAGGEFVALESSRDSSGGPSRGVAVAVATVLAAMLAGQPVW